MHARLVVKIPSLAVPLVGMVILVTQVVTGVINHGSRVEALRTRANLLASSQAEALALPMWNLDWPMAAPVLAAVALDPGLVSGRIIDATGDVISETVRDMPKGEDIRMTIVRPIRITRGGEVKELGQLVLEFHTAAIQESVTRQLLIGFAAFVAMIVGLAIVLLYIPRRLVLSPLHDLLDAMKQAEHRHRATVRRVGHDEIGRVCSAFNRMVESLRAGQQAQYALAEAGRREAGRARETRALQESESRLRLILETTPIPIVILRVSDVTLSFANKRAVDLFGIPTESDDGERLARPQPLAFWFSETDPERLRDRLTEAADFIESEAAVCTELGRRWAAVSGAAMDYDGASAMMLVMNDITDRKLIEDEPRDQHEVLETTLTELREVQESLVQSEKTASSPAWRMRSTHPSASSSPPRRICLTKPGSRARRSKTAS